MKSTSRLLMKSRIQDVHYYFKIDEFKVRDGKMNPILKNTLFEMMSKNAEKRLELGQARRRLNLQRYISAESRPTVSRVRRP